MKRIIVCALCLGLLIAGCAGRVKYPKYYTLDLAAALKAESDPARLPAAVAVRRFETPAYLRQGRIVYREAPEAVDFYEYHRWAADPGPTVTNAMITSIRSACLFAFVKPYDGEDKPDYVMSGRLEKLDEVDYGGAVRVEAKLSAELVEAKSGTIVWTGDANATLKVESSNVNAVVAAMTRALQINIDRLVADMAEQIPPSTVATRR